MIRALTDVAHKWRHIGEALGLPFTTLETIALGKSEEALSSMVSKWLAMAFNVDKFSKPSWDALVKAVAEPAGGANRTVAEEIARQYPGEPEGGTYRYTASLVP